MERSKPSAGYTTTEKLNNLYRTFGDTGTAKLMSQIAYDNPALTEEEVIGHAWSLIPEATAYALPAEQEDLTESAINIHEGYEAFRRIQD